MSQPPELSYGREKHTASHHRLRWVVKWFSRICMVLVILLVIAHAACTIWATCRFNALVEALAAAGEPVQAADLQYPKVADEQNVMVGLASAADELQRHKKEKDRAEMLEATPVAPLINIERTRLRAYIDRGAAASQLIGQATTRPSNTPSGLLPVPLLTGNMPMLSKLRSVAVFSAFAMEMAHDGRRDDVAIGDCEAIEAMSAAAAAHPTVVGYLVADGIWAIQATHIAAIAPTLQIGWGGGAASPAEVRKLMARLLDNHPVTAAERLGMQGERVGQIQMLAAVDDGDYSFGQFSNQSRRPFPVRYLFRPLVRWNEGSCVDVVSRVIATIPAPDWPTARAQLAKISPGPAYLNLLTRLVMPSYSRALEARYRTETDRALAAVALAVRLHEVEIGGLPKDWSDLVPRYLPTIPLDPMAAARPLQARFDGDDPIVWSVGTNGTDDGGDDQLLTGTYNSNWVYRDRVLHLVVQLRRFSADEQLLIDLDLDSPVRKSPPATTQPTLSGNAPADEMNPPDWEQVLQFDIAGDAAVVKGIVTRREAFAALVHAIPAASAITRPAGAVVLQGWVRFGDGVWQFEFNSDDQLTLITPSGQRRAMSWKPYNARGDERAFWR